MTEEKHLKSIVEIIKENRFYPLLNSTILCCFYVKEDDSIAVTDQGGFIPTRNEFDELVEHVHKFYDQMSEEEIVEHNRERYEEHFPSTKVKSEKPPKFRRKQPGHVYLIQAATDEALFKIGRTKHLPSRLKTIGLKLPFEVKLVHSIEVEDSVLAEASLHNRFATKRMNGEWFKLDREDVEWICSLTNLEE